MADEGVEITVSPAPEYLAIGHHVRHRGRRPLTAIPRPPCAQADKIVAITSSASVEVEPIWASLLAKALEGKDVKSMLSNIGAGGGAPAAAGPGAAAAGGAAAGSAEPAAEEKKEEAKEGESSTTEEGDKKFSGGTVC